MQETFNTFNSLSQACRYFNFHLNKKGFDKIKKIIQEHNIDISHFNPNAKQKKYEIITKECPICKTSFVTQKGHSREKQTCSYSCSNTFFRSGMNNPNWGNFGDSQERNGYRRICFDNHKKECVICGENKIVTVHHYDNNHNNNDPKNLIPLCPTHHQYVHSRYKDEVISTIDEYIKNKVLE